MRIALVAPQVASPSTAADGPSGPGPQAEPDTGPGVTLLARALGGLGHRVTVYTRKDSPGLPARSALAPRVTVEHVPAGPAARIRPDELGPHIGMFGDYLARRWRSQRPDVAHAHSWTGGLATLAGARGLGVPVVQTFHSARGSHAARRHSPGERDQAARARLRLSLARNASAVLVSSSGDMSELAGLGVPRTSIRVVPLGVDTGRFVPEGPTAQRSRRPRLLTVAPLAEWQGLDVVLRALAEVPQAELVVAGGPGVGVVAGETFPERLMALASDLGVDGRVTPDGDVTPRDLPALLRSADLLVSAAWDEPFGMVALEAMACGTPVVGSAVGILRDAVIDGTTGVLVPPGHPALLARRMRTLLASPLRLEAYGIASADRARSRYSWERIGRETVQAYEHLLDPAPDSGPAAPAGT